MGPRRRLMRKERRRGFADGCLGELDAVVSLEEVWKCLSHCARHLDGFDVLYE